MGTFLDLRNKIATDLTRTDLDGQTKNAVADAISFYEPERFWFNQTRKLTFPTIVGQFNYGAAALTQIPNVIEFDQVFIYPVGVPSNKSLLCKREVGDFEWLIGSSTANVRPTDYCYSEGELLLWPTPNAVFTVRPIMHYRLPMLSADTDSTAWCNEAENLIRAHAKLILLTNVVEDDEGSARMQAQIPALKMRLDEETSARMASGTILGTDF